MPTITCAIPIPIDKMASWKAARTNLNSEEHADARRRLGISRELVNMQRLAATDIALIYIELRLDPGQILLRMQTSKSTFYRWLSHEVPAAIGITPPQSPPRPLIEWPAR